MSLLIQQGHSICKFDTSDSWVILSPIEQSIKNKIESVGTPLKDWDINIYRGVLTGYNEAFIISTEKRNEILKNCKTSQERKKTEEIIRPILRGRDIKRYSYDWADLWLINTHNGVRGKIPRIDINEYLAVKEHLDNYWTKIQRRSDQGDTPYNLRNCAYLDYIYNPKYITGLKVDGGNWRSGKLKESYFCIVERTSIQTNILFNEENLSKPENLPYSSLANEETDDCQYAS